MVESRCLRKKGKLSEISGCTYSQWPCIVKYNNGSGHRYLGMQFTCIAARVVLPHPDLAAGFAGIISQEISDISQATLAMQQ